MDLSEGRKHSREDIEMTRPSPEKKHETVEAPGNEASTITSGERSRYHRGDISSSGVEEHPSAFQQQATPSGPSPEPSPFQNQISSQGKSIPDPTAGDIQQRGSKSAHSAPSASTSISKQCPDAEQQPTLPESTQQAQQALPQNPFIATNSPSSSLKRRSSPTTLEPERPRIPPGPLGTQSLQPMQGLIPPPAWLQLSQQTVQRGVQTASQPQQGVAARAHTDPSEGAANAPRPRTQSQPSQSTQRQQRHTGQPQAQQPQPHQHQPHPHLGCPIIYTTTLSFYILGHTERTSLLLAETYLSLQSAEVAAARRIEEVPQFQNRAVSFSLTRLGGVVEDRGLVVDGRPLMDAWQIVHVRVVQVVVMTEAGGGVETVGGV